MIALFALAVVALLSFWAPGLALAGVFFGYAAGAAVGNLSVTTYYLVAAFTVLLARCLVDPPRIRVNAVDLAFVAFVFWHFSTSSFMINTGVAVAGGMDFLVAVCAIYLLARIVGSIGSPERRLQELCIGLCVVGAVTGVEVIFAGTSSNGRWQVGDASEVGIAQSFPFATTAGAGILLMPERRRAWHIVIGLAGLGGRAYVTLLSGTRGNLLAFGAAGLFLALIGQKTVMLRLSALAVAVFALAGVLDFSAATQSVGRLLDFAAYGSSADASSSIRMQYYTWAWSIWEQSPIIGAGIGSFTYMTGAPYPHNIFLEIGAEAGLVGILLFLIFAFFAFQRVLATGTLRLGWAGTTFMACVIGGCVQHQVSMSVADAKSILMLGLAAGFAIPIQPKSEAVGLQLPARRYGEARYGNQNA